MTVSPLFRRFGALAILFSLVWLAWSGLAEPILAGIAQDGRSIVQSRQILADYAQFEAELPSLEQHLAELRASGAETAGFLEGPNPAIIAARLQGDVQQIAAASDIALRSSQTVTPVKEGSFQRIGLALELAATPAGLQHLLHRIETATPALFIRKLSIHLPEDGTAPMALDGQPLLTIRLELCGYQRETVS